MPKNNDKNIVFTGSYNGIVTMWKVAQSCLAKIYISVPNFTMFYKLKKHVDTNENQNAN